MFTGYEGPDVLVVHDTFQHREETQRIVLDSGSDFENAAAFLTDGHNGTVNLSVNTESGGCSGRQTDRNFI
jgi:hypothetical protein